MNDGSNQKDQLIHDLHDSIHHTSDANARFLAHHLELAGHGDADSVPHPGVSRKEKMVTVTSKSLVMEVLHNTEGHYSVAGYNARAKHCFGEIYLGLDAGPEYDHQANKINEAIGSISAGSGFRSRPHAHPSGAGQKWRRGG